MIRRFPAYLILMSCLVACLSGNRKTGRLIPESEFEEICAEMLLADQWSSKHFSERKRTDSTAFYLAVFERHGYSSLDYDRSVRHYLRDPEEFSAMIKDMTSSLREELGSLKRKAAWEHYLDSLRNRPGAYKAQKFDFNTISDELSRKIRLPSGCRTDNE